MYDIIAFVAWGYSSAGRALEWHSRGQRFDPAYLHQKQQTARPTPCGLVISKSGYIPSPKEAGEFTVHLLLLFRELFFWISICTVSLPVKYR